VHDRTADTPDSTTDALEVHREPFEVIARSTLQDSRLTFRARGLLGYMLSLPPDWRFSAERIAADSLEGRDAVRGALNELVALGYVRRTRGNGGDGRIATTVQVAARPVLLPPATGSQAPVRQSAARQAPKREQTESTETEQVLPLAPLARSAEPSPAADVVRRTFDGWWQTYPRKVGKRAAEAAYRRALKRASPSVLLDGARTYRDDPNREDAFTAHPTTWLNRDGWNDDPLPPRATTGSTGSDVHGILDRAMQRAQAAENAQNGERKGLT
jgi:hypothetical protein